MSNFNRLDFVGIHFYLNYPKFRRISETKLKRDLRNVPLSNRDRRLRE